MELLKKLFQSGGAERRNNSAENTTIHYKNHIRPGMKALVVGPSKHLSYDPSLLYTAQLLGPDGVLYICDPQSSAEKDRRKAHAHTIRGYGDTSVVIAELEELRKLGMELPRIEWLGRESYIQATGLGEGSVDVIVDHGTSPFVAGSVSDNSSNREKDLGLIYPEYSRVLKTGGTLILQTHRGNYDKGKAPLTGEIATALNPFFQLSYHRVDDMFQIPVSDTLARGFESSRVDNPRYLPGFQISNVPFQNMNSYNTDHHCPDLYIGKII